AQQRGGARVLGVQRADDPVGLVEPVAQVVGAGGVVVAEQVLGPRDAVVQAVLAADLAEGLDAAAGLVAVAAVVGQLQQGDVGLGVGGGQLGPGAVGLAGLVELAALAEQVAQLGLDLAPLGR